MNLRTLSIVLLLAPLASAVAHAQEAPSQPTSGGPATGEVVEVVRFTDGGAQRSVTGRILVEDSDGGVLVQGTDGVQWIVEADNVLGREAIEAPFTPLSQEEVAKRVLATLPEGFKSLTTPHYVVCYNTTRPYAQWTSSLLERLHRAFTNYWQNQGLELQEPEFPLVVVIYATADQYRAASTEELGDAASSIIGYYSLTTNRVNMYDLTGSDALRAASGSRGSLAEINQMLAQPAAQPLVATIVHEATHQIAFNCGLQQRLAELPLWLVEGMAVYFEAPDLSSTRGWRGIGKVNHLRLDTFKNNLGTPRRTSLLAMIADDKVFRDPRTATDAYADAWALNYFLIRYQPDKYVAYVKHLSQQKPLVPTTPEARIEEFRKHFGDIERLDREFQKRMSRIN